MNDDERPATRRVEELLHALEQEVAALTDAVETKGGPDLDCNPKEGPCRACEARARVEIAIDGLQAARRDVHRGRA